MAISASEIWISETDSLTSNATPISSNAAAPETFESMEEVERFVQSQYPPGDYQILRLDSTVHVEPEKEAFEYYTQEEVDMLEEHKESLANEDDITYVSLAGDSYAKGTRVRRFGVTIELPPHTYAFETKRLVPDDETEETVAKRLTQRFSDLHLIGWKSSVYTPRRGARGERAVRVAFDTKEGRFAELRELADDSEHVIDVFPEESVVYQSYLREKELDTDEIESVVLTDIELPDKVIEDYDKATFYDALSQVEDFEQRVREDTDWKPVSLGRLTTTEHDSLQTFGIGLLKSA